MTDKELAALWHKDGLSALNQRVKRAQEAYDRLRNKSTPYAYLILSSKLAWENAAIAFNDMWNERKRNMNWD